MPRELFVYWKVEAARADEAHAAGQHLLQLLRVAAPALQARLMRRADEAGEHRTYMETYSAGAAGVTPDLEATIASAAAEALAGFPGLRRHVEAFERLDPPG